MNDIRQTYGRRNQSVYQAWRSLEPNPNRHLEDSKPLAQGTWPPKIDLQLLERMGKQQLAGRGSSRRILAEKSVRNQAQTRIIQPLGRHKVWIGDENFIV